MLARSLPIKLKKILLIHVHPIIQKPDVSIHLTVAVKVNKAYIIILISMELILCVVVEPNVTNTKRPGRGEYGYEGETYSNL